MGLNFPNRSRSFDATKHRVRFWGYDSAMEILFFVETDALRKLIPGMSGVEADILRVFDTARERIHEVADKVYFRRPKGTYTCNLAVEDF